MELAFKLNNGHDNCIILKSLATVTFIQLAICFLFVFNLSMCMLSIHIAILYLKFIPTTGVLLARAFDFTTCDDVCLEVALTVVVAACLDTVAGVTLLL